MAHIIHDMYQAQLRARMKRARIRHRRSPSLPPLMFLPAYLMVLSAIMVIPGRASAYEPVSSEPPPPTMVECMAGIRGFPLSSDLVSRLPRHHSRCPNCSRCYHTPFFWCSSPGHVFEGAPSSVAEGDDGSIGNLLRVFDSLASFDDWSDCRFITGTSLIAPIDTPTSYDDSYGDDLWSHTKCFLSSYQSFGPAGLTASVDGPQTAVVDTGASKCVSPFRDDFVDYAPLNGVSLQGITTNAKVVGKGKILWKLEAGGELIDVYLDALHIPTANVRLLCHQQMRQQYSNVSSIEVQQWGGEITTPRGVVHCPLDRQSNLPAASIMLPHSYEFKAMHSCAMDEQNQNLTPSQKELLKWHTKLGHIDHSVVQQIMRTGFLGNTTLIRSAANINLQKNPILCASCAYAKAKRRSRRPKRSAPDTSPMANIEKELSKDVLIPGQKVSMDHFILSTPGRLPKSRGGTAEKDMFKGGVIFKDHATGYVHIEPVVNFTAGEALRAKKKFEYEMLSMGVVVMNYHTDNGVFTAAAFQADLLKKQQGLSLSGVGAHHQNAVAERAIGHLFSLCRTMMLHAKLRWPSQIKSELWPMALKHTQYLVNNNPGRKLRST